MHAALSLQPPSRCGCQPAGAQNNGSESEAQEAQEAQEARAASRRKYWKLCERSGDRNNNGERATGLFSERATKSSWRAIQCHSFSKVCLPFAIALTNSELGDSKQPSAKPALVFGARCSKNSLFRLSLMTWEMAESPDSIRKWGWLVVVAGPCRVARELGSAQVQRSGNRGGDGALR